MADKKISQLTGATTPLAGTEVLPIVQSGTTVKVSAADVTAGRSVSAANLVVTGSSVPANGVYLPSANSVGIATNSSGKLIVDASGEVLIGTTSVTAGRALDVRGGNMFNLTPNNHSYGNINETADTAVWQLRTNTTKNACVSFTEVGVADRWAVGTRGGNGSLFFGSDSSDIATATVRMTLSAGGDITANTGNLVLGTAGKGITTSGATALGLGVNGAVDAVTIDASKNVGVNVNPPEAKFHVRQGDPGAGTLAQFAVGYGGGTTNYYDGSPHVFRNASASEVVRITDGGDVGINETAPDYKLDVNGTFGFSPGASVTPVDNGDVVFELTNNTTLTVKAKGSDGVVRSATLTLT